LESDSRKIQGIPKIGNGDGDRDYRRLSASRQGALWREAKDDRRLLSRLSTHRSRDFGNRYRLFQIRLSRGGREKWLARIERIDLREITPPRVQRWKLDFLRRAGTNPLKARAARNSVNSLLRQAKSLFSPDHLQFLPPSVAELNPFKGVSFEPRQSMRYRADFDVERLIEAAQRELPIEQLKIFLLALFAGLRRNEIDKLEWNAFKWDEGLVRIAATEYFQPKSEDALNDVEVDPELLETFRGFRARASGDFVIESHVRPRTDIGYSHYRCEHHFSALTKWLRENGISTKNPIHTLRKEFGSQICGKHGIYAASHALRHADIVITSQHYVDNRRRATVGLGALLMPPTNIVPIRRQSRSHANRDRQRDRNS